VFSQLSLLMDSQGILVDAVREGFTAPRHCTRHHSAITCAWRVHSDSDRHRPSRVPLTGENACLRVPSLPRLSGQGGKPQKRSGSNALPPSLLRYLPLGDPALGTRHSSMTTLTAMRICSARGLPVASPDYRNDGANVISWRGETHQPPVTNRVHNRSASETNSGPNASLSKFHFSKSRLSCIELVS
jgi:hypothetical protein